MSLAHEIIRAFFVAFGAAQTILNATYLFKKGGIQSARKQHRELPTNATDTQMRIKVTCMLLFGISFLIVGLVSYFIRSYVKLSFIVAVCSFSAYALVEALYYKFWRTTGAFIVSLVLTIMFVLL